MVDCTLSLGSLRLANPILLASGTASYGRELSQMVDLSQVGGLVGKTITVEAREGNPPPRVIETPAGMLNSIGLQNPGVEEFEKTFLPEIAALPTPFIASIAGYSDHEWKELATRFDQMEAVAALELNLSCPNVKKGLVVGTSAQEITRTVRLVKEHTSKPLVAKLTPNVTDIGALAQAAQEGGAQAISLINTVLAMSVNWRSRTSNLSRPMAGLSGPAIKPIALRCVYQAAQTVDIPLLGIGGISSAEDILEFLVLGASAVQVGTHLFTDPFSLDHLLQDLRSYLNQEGLANINEIVGTFQPHPPQSPKVF